MSKITSIVDNVISKTNTNTTDIATLETLTSSHIGLSGITAYHLLQGNLAVDNYVTTQGFNTTLYTGNGSTQSINTGIDMDTQWGNDASEKFGGLVWAKGRSNANGNILTDTVRGVGKSIYTNSTTNELTTLTNTTAFNTNGFSIGANGDINTNLATYASWNFQTTHRVSGTTNHGKAYTCHYNPFTGFTIVKFIDSGVTGHEIPHHLGRKLDFAIIKNLTTAGNWWSHTKNGTLILDGTNTINTSQVFTTTDDVVTNLTYDKISGNSYILYGWANSYFDEANKLIGNYEVGIYQGTGASGNKVVTRGKPAWVMVKRLDSTGNWQITDNNRGVDKKLYPNLSSTEATGASITFNVDGFTHNDAAADNNISGGQYLYMVAYDTNSNGGGSFYEKSTDNAQIQAVNTIIPTAQGIDSNGVKNKIVYKNETITGISLLEGKNYVYWEND